jgi:enoyl-CoA hydratase/carnithine racemase
MAKFDDYSRSYRFIKMERRGGILQMTLHTDGGPLQWNLDAQVEFVRAFTDVGADRDNRIVILTGSGNEFSGPRLDPDTPFFHGAKLTPGGVHEVFVNARKMVNAVLGIEVPMIAAVNGPAKRHADLALMCDIVIAADDVTFEDTAHFHNGGIVPGDGINVVYTMLMGLEPRALPDAYGAGAERTGSQRHRARRGTHAAREAAAARVAARRAARKKERHAAALHAHGADPSVAQAAR